MADASNNNKKEKGTLGNEEKKTRTAYCLVKMLTLLPTFQKAQNRNIQNNTFPAVLCNSFTLYAEHCITCD